MRDNPPMRLFGLEEPCSDQNPLLTQGTHPDPSLSVGLCLFSSRCSDPGDSCRLVFSWKDRRGKRSRRPRLHPAGVAPSHCRRAAAPVCPRGSPPEGAPHTLAFAAIPSWREWPPSTHTHTAGTSTLLHTHPVGSTHRPLPDHGTEARTRNGFPWGTRVHTLQHPSPRALSSEPAFAQGRRILLGRKGTPESLHPAGHSSGRVIWFSQCPQHGMTTHWPWALFSSKATYFLQCLCSCTRTWAPDWCTGRCKCCWHRDWYFWSSWVRWSGWNRDWSSCSWAGRAGIRLCFRLATDSWRWSCSAVDSGVGHPWTTWTAATPLYSQYCPGGRKRRAGSWNCCMFPLVSSLKSTHYLLSQFHLNLCQPWKFPTTNPIRKYLFSPNTAFTVRLVSIQKQCRHMLGRTTHIPCLPSAWIFTVNGWLCSFLTWKYWWSIHRNVLPRGMITLCCGCENVQQ